MTLKNVFYSFWKRLEALRERSMYGAVSEKKILTWIMSLILKSFNICFVKHCYY